MNTISHLANRRLILALIALGVLSLLFSAFSVLTVLSAPPQTVTIPEKIGFEGFLADGGGNPVADGVYTMTFKIYSAGTGGSEIISQTLTSIPVTQGLYAVAIGPFIPDPFASSGDRWIGVTVNGGTEISPRSQVLAVPYALTAKQAGAVAWGDITGMPSAFADGEDDINPGGASLTGSGSAGQIPVFTSDTNLAGTDALTVTGGVNVGTASSASAGELRYSSKLTRYVSTISANVTGQLYVPLGSPWYATNNGYNYQGGAFNSGTYLVDVSTASGAPSSTAHIKAYYVRLLVKWASASDSVYAVMKDDSTGNDNLGLRSLVANFFMEEDGLVRADANGDIWLRIGNANATAVYVQIWGYFL